MYPGHHHSHHPPPMPSAPTSAAASFLAQFGSMPRSAVTTPGSPTMQQSSPLMHGHRPHSGPAGPTERKVSTDSVCSAGGRVPVSPALSFLSQLIPQAPAMGLACRRSWMLVQGRRAGQVGWHRRFLPRVAIRRAIFQRLGLLGAMSTPSMARRAAVCWGMLGIWIVIWMCLHPCGRAVSC
ncbi:hypothetical protein BCR44DRAFT_1281361 [Catenaria anguillulae PL171]|uniref:Uncharacterized protein n=1 Tax=Catenaria anguillulae PL171 TaxID=765915 RepID=A0A1Y2HYD2_9FUNG|nr:hypothetical protein BCR44DRAFT_1281361 [Catenaria anguillulae PL171]